MAKKTTKKPTVKQVRARKAFANKAKAAGKLVKSGQAYCMRDAWKKLNGKQLKLNI